MGFLEEDKSNLELENNPSLRSETKSNSALSSIKRMGELSNEKPKHSRAV